MKEKKIDIYINDRIVEGVAEVPDHQMEEIALKNIKVDKGIIPVVKWLNGFNDVFTTYSCQGDDNHKPYVMFCCMDEVTLVKILKEADADSTIEANFYSGVTRYVLRFFSTRSLEAFCNRLQILNYKNKI